MVIFNIVLCLTTVIASDYIKEIRFIRQAHNQTQQTQELTDEYSYTLRQTNEARLLLGGVIKLYQILVSPQGPPGCNYSVSCSQFMARAVRDHGALHGILMTADRLDRCIRSVRRYYPIDHRTGRAIDHPIEAYYIIKRGRRLGKH